MAGGRPTTPVRQGGEHRVYPDDLLPELQSALAALADLDLHFEIARDSLEDWSGPEEDKQRCCAELRQAHQHAREPHLWRLARLQERIRGGRKQPWDDARSFELLVNSVVDYAIFMLSPDGIVSTWNAGVERIKGYAAQEIIGQPFSCFYTDEDRATGVPDQALRTAASQGKYEAEGWRVRKDGSRFWASVVLDAIRDQQGQLLGFPKVTRDTVACPYSV